MKEKKSLALTFIFLLSIGVLLLSFTVFDVSHFFSGIIFQISLAFVVLTFFIAFVYLRRFIAEITYDVDEKREKEKNVRDCYQYLQLLNPPDTNN